MSGVGASQTDYIDADGHVLEHPDGFRRFAPKGFEDRVWHIEVDDQGREWAVMDGTRTLANFMSLAGTAGMSADDRDRAQRGELRYTEVRPAAWDADGAPAPGSISAGPRHIAGQKIRRKPAVAAPVPPLATIRENG